MVPKESPGKILCTGLTGKKCSYAGCCLMVTTTSPPPTYTPPPTTPAPPTYPPTTVTPAPTTPPYNCGSFYCPAPFTSKPYSKTIMCAGKDLCSIKLCCLVVTTTTPKSTTTPEPTTTPCPTEPPTKGAAPCSTAAYRLYANQQEAVVQKADMDSKGWMMPSMGMFAFFAVGGLAAGLGASMYRRSRRSTRVILPRHVSLEEGSLLSEMEGPVE